jgi:hypothetical protein
LSAESGPEAEVRILTPRGDKSNTSISEFNCPICGKGFERADQLRGHIPGKHSNLPRFLRPSIDIEGLGPYQIGYVAGFLDGEGGIQITRTRRRQREYTIALHPCVYFTNTNRKVIERIKTWVKSGIMVVSHSKKGYRDTYILHVTGLQNIIILLQCLHPHLITKQKQADLLLEYCKDRIEYRKRVDRHYAQAELQLYSALIQANKKGGKVTANSRKSDQGG